MGIWTLWVPTYWLDGIIKAITALLPLVTAVALVPLVPKVLAMRSPAELEAINRELETQITERKRIEAVLRESTKELRALYENLNKRNKDLEILNAINQAVHQSLNLQEVYRVALDKVIELGNVDMSYIYLVDETKNEAVLQAHRNLP
ncbi:MAG: hypothetical protein C4291_12760 [Candidatus Dadabacteria bacterium]